jgi:hypothetical protein
MAGVWQFFLVFAEFHSSRSASATRQLLILSLDQLREQSFRARRIFHRSQLVGEAGAQRARSRALMELNDPLDELHKDFLHETPCWLYAH